MLASCCSCQPVVSGTDFSVIGTALGCWCICTYSTVILARSNSIKAGSSRWIEPVGFNCRIANTACDYNWTNQLWLEAELVVAGARAAGLAGDLMQSLQA